MAASERRAPVRPGEPAPDFTLPAADREGTVTLADYRGRSPILLTLFRGLYCAFCRRHITQMSAVQEQLETLGVKALGVVATQPERARLYLEFHPTRLPLAADPELSTHRSYGLHKMPMTPLNVLRVLTTRINPTGELPKPMSLMKAGPALNQLDNFEPTDTDREDQRRQGPQLTGQFLIDRDGIVRWANVEGGREGPAGIGKFPTDEELLAAARALSA